MANRHAENSPCFNSEGEEDLSADFNLAEMNVDFFKKNLIKS